MVAIVKKLHISDDLSLPLDTVTATQVVYGGKGMGKRLALDTPLPTPKGWINIGDVSVGDELFDERGQVCRVTYISPIAFGDSYVVSFSDGPKIVADSEHLWVTEDYHARKHGRPATVRTTDEIRKSLVVYQGIQEVRNHSIRNAGSLVLPEKDLKVDPYMLGYWLGDGSSSGAAFAVSETDQDEVTTQIMAVGYDVNPRRCQPNRAPHFGVIGLVVKLRDLGVLNNKYVPEHYLRASIGQRLALLQGLLDSDGGVDGAVVRFDNKNILLADAVYELVVSLGMKATRAERMSRLYGVEHGLSHRVTFTPTMPVFRLKRKLEKLRFDRAQSERRVRRYISNVEPTEPVPMRCIAVDSPSHVYLAGRCMVPTHNTSLASVMAEEFYRARLKFSAIDPMGVMWGLQHGARRGERGLEVLILGGIHGDLPIEPTAGAVVADLVVDESVSTIIDISRHANGKSWTRTEKIRFVADYCTRLYERQGEKRDPIHQIIDEAGRFAPQQLPHGAVDISRCLSAIEQMVEEGRNIGIGMTLVTLRSARLAKSVSELADCMIAFRTIGPNSINAILDWFGEHVDKSRWNDLLGQLRKLPRGHALVVSPGWLEYEGVVKMRQRMTFDSSATPKPGRSLHAPNKATKPDLAKYRTRMAETIERVQQDDPVALRRRIKDLELSLSQTKKTVVPVAPVTPKVTAPVVKVSMFKNREIKALNHALHSLDRITKRLVVAQSQIGALNDAVSNVGKSATILRAAVTQTTQKHSPVKTSPLAPQKPLLNVSPSPVAKFPKNFADQSQENVVLDGPKQRILNAIAWFESVGITEPEITAVAFLAGYTVGGGAFNNPRGTLRNAGYIEYRGSKLALTDIGRRFAQVPDVPLTTDALLQRVYECLPGPEQKILKVAVDAYPNDIADEELAEHTGYTVDGGAFKNPKGRLRTLGLVTYPARRRVRAAELLFLGKDKPQRRIST